MTKKASAAPKAAVTTAAPAFKLHETDAAIDTALKSIHTRGQSLQKDMHIVACSVLKRVGATNDVRLVAKLLAALPESVRSNSVRDWFAEFGQVSFDEKGQPVYMRDKKTRLGNAMAMPFWRFSPEKPYIPIVTADAIAGLIKKLERDTKETKADHGALIAGLQKLAEGTAATAH